MLETKVYLVWEWKVLWDQEELQVLSVQQVLENKDHKGKEEPQENKVYLCFVIIYRSQNRTAHLRKSKRIEGRRFLTIGYDGEVRSPLRDRKNTPSIATVQRSKSAQTPSNKNKLHLNKKNRDEKEINQKENDEALCRKVQRSLSLRQRN